MIIKGINHIFFDLDHTLWDFDRNSAVAFERIFKMNNVRIDLSHFLEIYEPVNLKYWKLYREEQVSKTDLRYFRLKEAFDQLGFEASKELIDQLSEDYITYLTSSNHLFDGTLDILNYLNSKYQLHIITNGFSEAQNRKIQKSNIERYFHTLTNSEMVGVKKPNPKIFNFALNTALAEPEESLMIGDNIEADIEGAEQVGMSTIWFNYKGLDTVYSKPYINHLNQLKNYI